MSTRISRLEIKAAQCRLNVLRMLKASGHGHVGGALSAIDMVTALYFDKMNVDPKNPKMENRDRFLLSAGHKCLAQYAVLAEMGFFDKSVLDTYGQLKSPIPGHPDMHKLPGVEANTGALGHGLAIANGMAAAAKLKGLPVRVYTILGDGELPEGSNWEAAAQAAKFGLDNLLAIVDNNGLQISGDVTKVMDMRPIDEKFRAFGWAVRTIDGNDMKQIVAALDDLPLEKGKPTMILAKTVKAKGIPKGEGDPAFHFWKPTPQELEETEKIMQNELERLKKRSQC